jgi:hypothetical protein
VAIEAGDAVQGLALGAESPDEAAALAAEMKKLLKAYLALSVDPPGARPSGEDPRFPHPEDRR